MGGKKRNATAAGGSGSKRTHPIGAAVHAQSERTKIHIEHKKRELRALALELRLPRDPSGKKDSSTDSHFNELRDLAFSPHGFVSDDLRKVLWPLLLGSETFTPLRKDHENHFTKINAPHRDDQQIQKDIDRSMWHYDVVMGIREPERRVKRKQLTQIINAVVNDNAELYYYQGYHDVASVFLLVLGDQTAFHAIRSVSATYHREPMRKNFEIVLHATRLLYPLLESEDPELFGHMKESGVEPFFALPWMITWFAHQLSRLSDVARLYDVLLVSHPLFILYLSAAVVLDARHRVLNTECDFGTLHGLLAKLPLTMDLERVISRAAIIFHRFPPNELLKTSEHAAELGWSMYLQFPFPFHDARFSSISEPFLLPAQFRKRAIETTTSATKSNNNWQSSFVFRAAVVGLVAATLTFAFRHRLGAWLPIVSDADAENAA